MRSHWILCLVIAISTSAFGGQRVTVQELTQSLISLHKAGKSDAEVAASLQKLQLSEELTAGQAAALQQYVPGSLSLDQLAVLRGLSAFEPAAPSQPPASPAPDAAAQSALLARTGTWMTTAFGQTPTVTVSKVMDSFQEDAQSSTHGSQADADSNYSRHSGERTDTVEIAQGVEKTVNPGPKVNWGPNGQISEVEPPPSLPELLQAASAFGKPAFSRWEIIDGKSTAVFTFSVEKKKSHYSVEFCCFPISDTPSVGGGFGGSAPIIAPGTSTNSTSWKPFKKVVPFHGLLYIDPDSGAIVRTVTYAELKPFEYVHGEEERVDYATETVGGKACVVPVRSVTLNEIVPGADTQPKSYPVRRELISAEYANYRLAAQ
ncbi:MAG: hypothetical protein WAL75_02895 [Terracidiphilus sp.]